MKVAFLNSTVSQKPPVNKIKARQMAIDAYQQKFEHKFDMNSKAIDLTAMAKNFSHGYVPSKDISEAVSTIIGPPPVPYNTVDPRPVEWGGPGIVQVCRFAWVEMDDVGVLPACNRDICPSHVKKIEKLFQSDIIIVPCAFKDPVTGKFFLYDGNHTRELCARQGWKFLPVWYIEADMSNYQSVEEAKKVLTQKSGNSFLIINKSGKKAISRYEEHLIAVASYQPIACAVDAILTANKCRAARIIKRPGDVTHISAVYDAYDLKDHTTGIQGTYLAKALKFHRTTWPQESIRPDMMVAMAM